MGKDQIYMVEAGKKDKEFFIILTEIEKFMTD